MVQSDSDYSCSAPFVMHDWYGAALWQLLQHMTQVHHVGHAGLWVNAALERTFRLFPLRCLHCE